MPRREPQVYLLRVELEDIRPLIWRRLWLGGDATLLRLHHVLQAAMGWTDAHLHEFHIKGQCFAVPDPDDGFERDRAIVDERPITLDSVLPGISEFRYWYDFGDDWWHRVKIEESRPVDDHSPVHGYVEAGERACPPEDSGGIPGYQSFLDAWARDRKGEEVREFLGWAGEDFDPARFDRHAANAALLRMAWNGWR
jgi:hypothetical protein